MTNDAKDESNKEEKNMGHDENIQLFMTKTGMSKSAMSKLMSSHIWTWLIDEREDASE